MLKKKEMVNMFGCNLFKCLRRDRDRDHDRGHVNENVDDFFEIYLNKSLKMIESKSISFVTHSTTTGRDVGFALLESFFVASA